MSPASSNHEWTVEAIRDLVQLKFGKRPCWYQLQVARALYCNKKDVIGCAATGTGKTLSFWIPLLMALEDGLDKMMVVVTPLNLLGKQNTTTLIGAGLSAIAVSAENATPITFKDIEQGKYHVVTINPELLMCDEMDRLWKKPSVATHVLNIVFDEGHCISQWGHFRKEYRRVGLLRYLIPDTPFYVASATMPQNVMLDIIELLGLRPEKTEKILRSNDRPDICLGVRGLVFPAKTYQDLAFLIANDDVDWESLNEGERHPKPKKFLVFLDNTKEAEQAAKYLRKLLPESLQDKVKYFHSTMTNEYREEELKELKESNIWGLCVTDAFGMGIDLPDIEIVVQWKATCNLSTLWQRFGRAARGQDHVATGILLVESKDLEEIRQVRAAKTNARRERKNKKKVQKRKSKTHLHHERPKKRLALGSSCVMNLHPEHVDESDESDSDKSDSDLPLANPSASPPSRIKTDEECRTHYSKRVSKVLADGKKSFVEPNSPMDDFINAESYGFPCRRQISNLFFGNDKRPTNDYILCDASDPRGCSRCKLLPTSVCCDICQPNVLNNFNITFKKPPKVSRKSIIKSFEMNEDDHKIQRALHNWRRDQAPIILGASIAQTYGVQLLLADEIINRIVGCIRANKIQTVAQLAKEMGWRAKWVEAHGESLLAAIGIIAAPSSNPGPLPGLECDQAHPAKPTSKRALPKCRTCRQVGHNARTCPQKQSSHPQINKNTPLPLHPLPPHPHPQARYIYDSFRQPIPSSSTVAQPLPLSITPTPATTSVPPHYHHLLHLPPTYYPSYTYTYPPH